eukprot:2741768-Amphidinium_carterae.1
MPHRSCYTVCIGKNICSQADLGLRGARPSFSAKTALSVAADLLIFGLRALLQGKSVWWTIHAAATALG